MVSVQEYRVESDGASYRDTFSYYAEITVELNLGDEIGLYYYDIYTDSGGDGEVWIYGSEYYQCNTFFEGRYLF